MRRVVLGGVFLGGAFLGGAFLLVLTLAGCSRHTTPPVTTANPQVKSAEQEGTASWYGHPFDGRLTANGEVYDMEKLTAAHRLLPFGTRLLVERIDNGKTIEIRVNDRGPYVKDRIIDLSHAAALSIGMQGIAPVRLHVLYKPRTRGPEIFAVQVGAFKQKPEAEAVRARLMAQYGAARLSFRDEDATWRVLVGSASTPEQADALAQKLDPALGPAFAVLVESEE